MLRTLHVYGHDISDDCAQDFVLPAVRKNTSLRELLFYDRDYAVIIDRHLAQAEGIVSARE